jgi:hypothetical protein
LDNAYQCHPYLKIVVEEDIRFLIERDKSYAGSWKQGGGKSAWYMLRRKMDRLIKMMQVPNVDIKCGTDVLLHAIRADDIFARIKESPFGKDGTPLAEVRDLRRYLTLVEAEMYAEGVINYADSKTHHSNNKMVRGEPIGPFPWDGPA